MKDRDFLMFIYQRLVNVHRENESYDYMHKLRAIIHSIPQNQNTPTDGRQQSDLETLKKTLIELDQQERQYSPTDNELFAANMKNPVAYHIKKRLIPRSAISVRVKNEIASASECDGFLVHTRHINARSAGAYGTYHGHVPGTGGDIWLVKHESGSVAAYVCTELTDDERSIQKQGL